tara:strand:- start:8523 stop:9656 length:1134 start_codon:yes stop_codon:yes gene_type:complete
MKINGNLLLVSNYPSDTAYAWWLMEHFWCLLADEYKDSGHRVYLAYPKLVGEISSVLTTRMEVVELDIFGSDATKSRDFIREHSIKTVYLTDRPFFSLTYFLWRLLGVKKILVHDHTPGDRPAVGGVKGQIKTLRNSLSLFTADAQFSVSPLMKTRSIENGRVSPSKIFSVQNGIPSEVVEEEQVLAREEIRRSLNIPSDAVVVITTGRAHPYKRPDFVMKAAAQLIKNSNSPVIFLLVGDGPQFTELESLHEQLGLSDNFRLLGYRNDVPKLLAASDIAVHAALGEGFSLSVLEYMRAGLVVLVPDIPSVKQAVEHGVNGLVYDWDDIGSLSSCISDLVEDLALRKEFGEQGKSAVATRFSLENCTKEFLSALNSI